jgi:hypothetical protein
LGSFRQAPGAERTGRMIRLYGLASVFDSGTNTLPDSITAASVPNDKYGRDRGTDRRSRRDGAGFNRSDGMGRHTKLRKTSWPPCAVCGDPDGPVYPGRRTPVRVRLQRVGLEGHACPKCYYRLRHRYESGLPLAPERRRLRAAEPKVKKILLPCVLCGDPAGGRRKGMSRPSRFNLKKFGIDGLGCQRCCVRLKSRARLGLVVDPRVVLRQRRGYPPIPYAAAPAAAEAEPAPSPPGPVHGSGVRPGESEPLVRP